MRLFRGLLSCLIFCAVVCQATWADEPGAEKNKAAAVVKEAQQDAQKDIAKKDNVQEGEPEKKPLVFKPKDISMPVPDRVPKAAAKPQAEKKRVAPVADKQRRVPRRPPWQGSPPRQGRLSAGAAFRIENMGRHAPLSPAMRFHLHRSGREDYVTQNVPIRRQQAPNFYPGVSRLPAQKPFANIERPAPALERYWPLLLEGREDPHTGIIIWSLP